jgi:hypothetical protein
MSGIKACGLPLAWPCCSGGPRAGAEQLSEPADPHHRALPRRRHCRHRRPRASPNRSAATGSRRSSSKRGPAATAISAPPRSRAASPTATPGWSRDPRRWSIPTLYKDAGWDAMKDFKCVGLAVWNQSVAVVHPSTCRPRRIGEFVELARSKPGQLNFGNPGTGSSIDLTAQEAVSGRRHQADQCRLQGPAAGVDRPDDQPDAFRDRLAGAGAAAHQAGTVKPLAVFTEKRIADLPDVPTIAEAGYPGPPTCPGTASMCRRRRRTRSSKRSMRGSTRRCKSRRAAPAFGRRHSGQADVAAELASADEGGP